MASCVRVAALVAVVTAAAIGIGCSRRGPTKDGGTSTQQPSSRSTSQTTSAEPQRGSVQPGAAQPGGMPAEQPIDVNAMNGVPPMNAEEIAFAKRVREILARDQRITSQRIYIGVTHTVNGRHTDDPQVMLAGSVPTHDEWTAVRNDLTKVGINAGNSLSIRPPAVRSRGRADTPAPWTEPSDLARPSILLCPGLAVVTAITSQGDYESIKTVESIDAKGIRLKYSSESTRPWWEVPPWGRNCEPGAPNCAATKFVTHRTVLAGDLESAHKYDQIFVTSTHSPETNPGTTAIGTSAAVLRELKATGRSEISLCDFAEDSQLMENGQLHDVPAGCASFRTILLERMGNAPVRVRILLNGDPADVPAVQARRAVAPSWLSITTGSDERDEFFFLDDERNPLTLQFRLGIGAVPALDPKTTKLCETAAKEGMLSLGGNPPQSCDLPDGGDRDVLRVIKISTRCELPPASRNAGVNDGAGAGASALEKALSETGKVDIYSIYFSFNSDKLRDESQPTLDDIAAVLRRHPDWKLQVSGHTDGIGGDQANLDLSKRRASAVKDALVSQYKVGADRLSTAGYGKSQPKDTNDTVEGRARNRRVELRKL